MEAVSGRTLSWAYQPLALAGRRPDGTVSHRLCRRRRGARSDCRSPHSDEEIREALADVMHAMRNDPPAAYLTWPARCEPRILRLDIPYEKERDVFGSLWRLKKPGPQVKAQR